MASIVEDQKDTTEISTPAGKHESTGPNFTTDHPDAMLDFLRDRGVDINTSTNESSGKLKRKLVLHIIILLGTINLMLFV